MYYLRARYLNTQTGRFHNMDTYEGRLGEPQTLHKYLYAHSNPVSNIDPSGNVSLSEANATAFVQQSLSSALTIGRLFYAYQRALAVVDTILFAIDTLKILSNPTSVLNNLNALRSITEPERDTFGRFRRTYQSVVSGSGLNNALETFTSNIPRAVSEVLRRRTYRRAVGKNIRSVLVYLPTPLVVRASQFTIPTSLRVRGVQVLATTTPKRSRGRFLGVGLAWGSGKNQRAQLFRMDWHRADGAETWRDGSYHFHATGSEN